MIPTLNGPLFFSSWDLPSPRKINTQITVDSQTLSFLYAMLCLGSLARGCEPEPESGVWTRPLTRSARCIASKPKHGCFRSRCSPQRTSKQQTAVPLCLLWADDYYFLNLSVCGPGPGHGGSPPLAGLRVPRKGKKRS